MKYFGFLTAIFILLFAVVCQADTITLTWDANLEEDLSHYSVYRAERVGDLSTSWEFVDTVPTGTTTFVDTVDSKNYVWMVTASDTSGSESFPSNMAERFDRTPPLSVQNLKTE